MELVGKGCVKSEGGTEEQGHAIRSSCVGSSCLVSRTRDSLPALLTAVTPLAVGGTMSCAGMEEHFWAASHCPSARAVIPSHFLPQEDVSKAEEMFLSQTGEP